MAVMAIEQASDDEIDPDWAVKVLEGIAAPLDEFSAAERSEFTAVLTKLATDRGRSLYQELPFMFWGE